MFEQRTRWVETEPTSLVQFLPPEHGVQEKRRADATDDAGHEGGFDERSVDAGNTLEQIRSGGDVTDETPNLKRKRRRWIIAGVLLFVVVAAGWWRWPTVDARFVGKWRLKDTPGREIHLLADGTERIFQDGKSEYGPAYTIRWRVDGKRFHSHIDTGDWIANARAFARYHWSRLTGGPGPGNYFDDIIERVDASAIELRVVGDHRITFERIPE